MPSPIWLDAAGRPRPTRPCPRCGVTVPIETELDLASARALGWTPGQSGGVVEWCGHGTEFLPSPWGLLPVVLGMTSGLCGSVTSSDMSVLLSTEQALPEAHR